MFKAWPDKSRQDQVKWKELPTSIKSIRALSCREGCEFGWACLVAIGRRAADYGLF